ncbi:MAG TPA: TadE/TadG family type IV pilus assembly protein [Pirellulales bacterium]|nr:TadE/TadG family type IV pilus assembly protein [Pirellulales bacterium]
MSQSTPTRQRAVRTRRGAVAVEAAFVLPLLVLLLFGAWEVGRYLDAAQIAANACREGGRQASTGLKSAAQIQANVLEYLSANNVSTSGATAQVANLTSGLDPTAANQLDQLQVTVTVPVANIRWLNSSFFTSAGSLSWSSIWSSMRDVPVNVNTSIPPE